MAREADYEKMVQNEKNPYPEYEKVKEKFGREEMSSKEFIVYLSHFKYGDDNIPMTPRTLRNYVERLCELSNGRIKPENFKKGRDYCFKPEYHRILLVLLNTDYFGENIDDKSLEGRTILHKQLADNVNRFLNKEEQEFVRGNPAYLNAILEGKLGECLSGELKRVLNGIYTFDPAMRYQVMVEALGKLVGLRHWIDGWQALINNSRAFYADSKEEIMDAAERKGKFRDILIDDILINMLVSKITGEKYEYVSESELLPYPAVYTSAVVYEMRGLDENEVQKYYDEVDRAIEDQDKYKLIMAKAMMLFDENDPMENNILILLAKLVKCQYAAEFIHTDDYEKMIRFTEDTLVDDKERLIEKLGEIEGKLTEVQMKELMDIKDRKKLKAEKGYKDV